MKKFIIKIPESVQTYPIIIGEGLLEISDSYFDFAKYSSITIITGHDIPEKWLNKLTKSLPAKTHIIKIPAGEKSKNINTVIDIWNKLQQFGMDRKSLVINLGGGVICDLGGFAASTFLRGIDFLQIPTTVLAQVDASVGGKVGFNFNNIKNYIGLFRQPIGVIVDVETLSTLPKRVFEQGFGEIIKHGLIADKEYFDLVTSKKPSEFNTSELTQIFAKSIEIKTNIVQADEREQGIRRLINFGHTIGHALESLSFDTKNPLLHGEAVHLGMIVETKISEMLNILDKNEASRIIKSLSATGLPVQIPQMDINKILEKLKLDKKSVKKEINWTLLKSKGEAVINQKVDDNIVKSAIKLIFKK